MRQGIYFGLILLTIGVTSSWPAYAGQPWTIRDLVEKGLSSNPELRVYEAEIAAAKGQRQQAGLWKNPEISGEFGHRRVSDSASASNGYTVNVAVTQTFEFPGKASLRKAMAQQDIRLAELGLAQFRLALEGKITLLSYQYIINSTQAELAEEINDRCQSLVNLLGQRPSAGSQQFLELKVIQGSLFELQKSSRDFIQSRDEAQIELRRLLGLPKSQPLEIDTRLGLPALKSDSTALVLRGLSGNFQLKIRIAEVEKAIKNVSAAKLDASPDFAVGPFFSQDKAAENEVNIGVSVTTSLPLWNANQGNISTSQARRAQADALLMDARGKVESEILRRLRSLELTQKQLAQMPEGTLKSLREAADLADRQYRTGVIGVQLLMETQRGLLGAQKTYGEAQLGAWRDLLDLELLTGGSLEEKK